MYSGGSAQEEPYSKIYIEASRKEAKVIFRNRFGHDPDRVTCSCCGEDYSIYEYETLEACSAYYRNCRWSKTEEKYIEEADTAYNKNRKVIPIEEYVRKPDVLVIRKEEIKPEERK